MSKELVLVRPSFEVNVDASKAIHELTQLAMRAWETKRDTILDRYLRTLASPPIKGEMTAGKLKWRGIVMCQTTEVVNGFVWLEQRGEIIGDKIPTDLSIDLDV